MKRSQKDARVFRNTVGVARLGKITTSARKSSGERSLELVVSGSYGRVPGLITSWSWRTTLGRGGRQGEDILQRSDI
jgi:hypothetical protein